MTGARDSARPFDAGRCRQRLVTRECGDYLREVARAVDLDAVDDERFAGACIRHQHAARAAFAGEHRRGEYAGYRAQRAVEPELAEHDEPVEDRAVVQPVADERRQRDRQISAQPALRRSAGAKLIVTRLSGRSWPHARNALRIRTPPSFTGGAASPTTLYDGS